MITSKFSYWKLKTFLCFLIMISVFSVGCISDKTHAEVRKDNVNVLDYGAAGDGKTDDTIALQKALQAGASVYLPEGRVFVVDTLRIPSNSYIFGGGTIKFKNNTTAGTLFLAQSVTNIKIENIIFDGNIQNNAFDQHKHCITLLAANNVQISSCTFINIIGDGVYISYPLYTLQPGSSNVTITDNKFLGSNTNRNGVSLISCSNITITGNKFDKMARYDMPGAIDLEPNTAAESISHVKVSNNTFTNGDSPAPLYQMAVAVANVFGSLIDDIIISDNYIDGKFYNGIIIDDKLHKVTNVEITNNVVKNIEGKQRSASGIAMFGAWDFKITGNNISSITGHGIFCVGASGSILNNTITNTSASPMMLDNPGNYINAGN
ncbi:MAG: right-handed parallel beta-helix repeat-containing protein [Negativicutes bacterium]|nr:right-handed parallel beta-helix repeat-containing protein [Negativicutes bacterium]